MYKVFLVEDEIVTREGIRDNVDCAAASFEFCGEASDWDWHTFVGPLPALRIAPAPVVGIALYDRNLNWEMLRLFYF